MKSKREKTFRGKAVNEMINTAIVGLGRWGELLVMSLEDSEVIKF